MKKAIYMLNIVALLFVCSLTTFAIDTNENFKMPILSEVVTQPEEYNMEIQTLPPTTKIETTEKVTEITTTEKATEKNTTVEDVSTPVLNATFNPVIPDGLTGDIVISLHNDTTNENFHYKLFEENDYFSIVELPLGLYEIYDCTFENDDDNRFVFNKTYFYVGDTMNTMVSFRLFDTYVDNVVKDEQKGYYIEGETETNVISIDDFETMGIIEENATQNITLTEEESENQTTSNHWVSTVIPVIVLIVVLLIYFYKKKEKLSKKEEDFKNDSISRY